MKAYVAVSCVSMHVLTSSTPVFQSRLPEDESSPVRGGTDTVWPKAPVLVAPSISEPPRKQTRWSCLGVRRHELFTGNYENPATKAHEAHISPLRFCSGMSSAVYVIFVFVLFCTKWLWTAVMASSYICRGIVSVLVNIRFKVVTYVTVYRFCAVLEGMFSTMSKQKI